MQGGECVGAPGPGPGGCSPTFPAQLAPAPELGYHPGLLRAPIRSYPRGESSCARRPRRSGGGARPERGRPGASPPGAHPCPGAFGDSLQARLAVPSPTWPRLWSYLLLRLPSRETAPPARQSHERPAEGARCAAAADARPTAAASRACELSPPARPRFPRSAPAPRHPAAAVGTARWRPGKSDAAMPNNLEIPRI